MYKYPYFQYFLIHWQQKLKDTSLKLFVQHHKTRVKGPVEPNTLVQNNEVR